MAKALTRERTLAIAAQMEALGYILRENRVAVIRDEGDTQIGRIIIPDASTEKPLSGVLVAIGTGIQQDMIEKGTASRYAGLALGDWLTFSKYDGTKFRIPLMDGETIDVEVLHGFDIYFSASRKGSIL